MMSTERDFAQMSLRRVMRPIPELTPEDSLGRFIQSLRYHGATQLPVHHNGQLCGVASQVDVLPLLAQRSPEEREAQLRRPVADILRTPAAIASPEMTHQEVGLLCARHGLPLIPVVDSDNYLLGVVFANDLLVPDVITPRPVRVGGMATPFGVYLTDGTLQAGVGNESLVATGAAMGLILGLSFALVRGSFWLLEGLGIGLPAAIFNPFAEPPDKQPLLGLGIVGFQLLIMVVFMLLMRLTRLAGYHAAEHQTVHAIERNEPLTAEVVARMPRPHPRCGTNLMAAVFLFYTLFAVLSYVPYMGELSILLAALVTVFSWRPFGTFLQANLTTRPAKANELASGIVAGKDLLDQYLHTPPARPNLWRRLWCMGLAQILLGKVAVLALYALLFYYARWL